MKKQTIEVFCCDFCGKVSRNAGAMTNHEKHCIKNPHTHALCYSCENCRQIYRAATKTIAKSNLKCTQKGKWIYSSLLWSKSTKEFYLNNHPDDEVAMPSKSDVCPFYRQKGYSEPTPSGEPIELSEELKAKFKAIVDDDYSDC